jgi:hypothetical protein
MVNFSLQTGPYSFLKLHISPWGNPFLLFSLFFFYLAFSFIHWRLHLFLSLSLVYPLLHRLGLQASRGAGRRPGALLPRAAAAQGWRRRARACARASGASGSRRPGELAQAGVAGTGDVARAGLGAEHLRRAGGGVRAREERHQRMRWAPAMQGGSAGARTQGAGEGAAGAQARERWRGGRLRLASRRCAAR